MDSRLGGDCPEPGPGFQMEPLNRWGRPKTELAQSSLQSEYSIGCPIERRSARIEGSFGA